MDAEARPGSRVLAHVGLRGATYADLRAATQLAPEALDAALKALRASRLIVWREGRWFQPQALAVPEDDDPAPSVREQARAAAKAGWAKRKAERPPQVPTRWELERQAARLRVQERHDRYMRVVTLWRTQANASQRVAESEGITLDEARRLIKLARAWWNREGRP